MGKILCNESKGQLMESNGFIIYFSTSYFCNGASWHLNFSLDGSETTKVRFLPVVLIEKRFAEEETDEIGYKIVSRHSSLVTKQLDCNNHEFKKLSKILQLGSANCPSITPFLFAALLLYIFYCFLLCVFLAFYAFYA